MAGQERQHETWSDPPSAGGSGEGTGPGGRGAIELECLEFCPICRTADVFRATMPDEFQDHWHAWQREMLLAFRSLLDHYIEHVDTRRRRTVSVEDIPIE
jgi:hypothetical protein